MRILIAPDKFKGSLSAMEVCQAITQGFKQAGKALDIHAHPMADGGDGSLEIIDQHLHLQEQHISTKDPLGRSIQAFYYTASNVAFIEMAKASGLVLLDQGDLNPMKTTSLGTGLMIADAISNACDELYLFLGGSATNDGGMGIAGALGVHFYDKAGTVLAPCGENLAKVVSLSVDSSFDLEKIKFTLLCDVNNPLLGPNGAAQVYARQKGADDAMIQLLEKGMQHFSQVVSAYSGVDVASLPGSGAAGGIAAALVSIFNAKIKSGTDSFAELTDLEAQIEQADMVIGGEGKLDSQSLQGKVLDGLARLCKKHHKPLLLFVGKNDLPALAQQRLGAKQIFSIFERADHLDDAMTNASKHLSALAFNCARTYF